MLDIRHKPNSQPRLTKSAEKVVTVCARSDPRYRSDGEIHGCKKVAEGIVESCRWNRQVGGNEGCLTCSLLRLGFSGNQMRMVQECRIAVANWKLRSELISVFWKGFPKREQRKYYTA